MDSSPLFARSPTPSAVRLQPDYNYNQTGLSSSRTPLIQTESQPPTPPPSSSEEVFSHGRCKRQRQLEEIRRHPYRFVLLGSAVVLSLLPLLWVGTLSASTSLGPPDAVNCQQTLWEGCGLQGGSCLPFNSSSWCPVRCGPYCLAR